MGGGVSGGLKPPGASHIQEQTAPVPTTQSGSTLAGQLSRGCHTTGGGDKTVKGEKGGGKNSRTRAAKREDTSCLPMLEGPGFTIGTGSSRICFVPGGREAVQGPTWEHLMKLSFEDRLARESQRAKEQADRLEPGPERDALMNKVRQLDVACRVNEWLSSSGRQLPKSPIAEFGGSQWPLFLVFRPEFELRPWEPGVRCSLPGVLRRVGDGDAYQPLALGKQAPAGGSRKTKSGVYICATIAFVGGSRGSPL